VVGFDHDKVSYTHIVSLVQLEISYPNTFFYVNLKLTVYLGVKYVDHYLFIS